jgi:tetratricopeptide (TPR) repeat protein
MALTYRSIGLYEDALRYFTECRDSDADIDYIKDEIGYQTGLCYFDMGWTKEALYEFRKHLEACPGDTWAHMSVGNCYFDFGWIDESAAKFKEIITLSPEFIPAYNALALSLAEKGWYDEALDVLRTALKISPDDETVKDNMDYIQSLKEDDDGAKGVILLSLILQLLKRKEISD